MVINITLKQVYLFVNMHYQTHT